MRLTAFVPASAKTPWSGALPSKARRNADRHSHERLACPISEFRNLVLTDRRCQGLRSSSCSLAMLAAIRRASSRVRSLAAALRPGSSAGVGSPRWTGGGGKGRSGQEATACGDLTCGVSADRHCLHRQS